MPTPLARSLDQDEILGLDTRAGLQNVIGSRKDDRHAGRSLSTQGIG